MKTIEAAALFNSYIQKDITDISVLIGGMVGDVFKIDTIDQSYVLKLDVKSSEVETLDDRVYGSNRDNLLPTYELLQERGIATFELYAEGETANNTFSIFSLLEGVETTAEITNDPIYAKTLAQIHSVQRPYQGWVMNQEPYKMSWKSAFTKSIISRLEDVEEILSEALYIETKKFIEINIINLDDPDQFVLSHLDGLQALFKRNSTGWALSGVIDVEDYQFTDQRFVLSGITLMEKFGAYSLSGQFWSTYENLVKIDESFKQFENLFQVYYLLVWIKVHTGNDDSQEECISVLKTTIK